jgi:hypothetical protein
MNQLTCIASERAPASAPQALRRVRRSFSEGGSEPREVSQVAEIGV